MNLLIAYIVALVIAQSLAVGAGLIFDRMYSSHASLVVFLALYFLMFILAWKFAVRLTEPKSTARDASTPAARQPGSRLAADGRGTDPSRMQTTS